tara:strand:+ start:788 stop:1156 length:369 start_codon:yes stop_codon:yes gene_type:complete
MGKIKLKNVKIYSNHGCLDEERLIGSEYLFQLEINTDLKKASKTDNLNNTIDYVSLYSIIHEEAIKRSKLLENVANKILDRIFRKHENIKRIKIEVSKLNPPINGNVEAVSIVIKRKRNLNK